MARPGQSVADERVSFMTEYWDATASITRRYLLIYFPGDKTVELHDVKTRKIFLRRTACPSLLESELRIGATVVVFSRALKIVEYGDSATATARAASHATALVVIKPDGYVNSGSILGAIAGAGLRIQNVHMVRLSRDEAAVAVGEGAADWCSAHPVLLVVVSGANAAATLDALIGPEDPSAARAAAPTSLRARFGTSAEQNVVALSAADPAALRGAFARSNAALSECAVCVVRPHAVADGNAPAILQGLLDAGLEVSALTSRQLTPAEARDFLDVYRGVVPEHGALTADLSAGTSWCIEVRCPVPALRAVCGPHDPSIAKALRPASLRARFGTDRAKNAVHCTDLPDDGPLESKYLFQQLPPVSP